MDLPLLDGDTFEASKAKLAALDKADKERVEKETALNELQSFNFDLGDKIYQEDHEAASTGGGEQDFRLVGRGGWHRNATGGFQLQAQDFERLGCPYFRKSQGAQGETRMAG